MRITIRAMSQKRDGLKKQILMVQSIRTKIQEFNSKLFNHLHQKLEQLTGPPITCDSSLESLSTDVITIP